MSRLGIYWRRGAVRVGLCRLRRGRRATDDAGRNEQQLPAALTKEEFLAQGDGICAEVNAAVGTVG